MGENYICLPTRSLGIFICASVSWIFFTMSKEELMKIGKESYKQGGIDAIESVLETMETAKLTVINKDQLGIILAKYRHMSLELTDEEKKKIG